MPIKMCKIDFMERKQATNLVHALVLSGTQAFLSMSDLMNSVFKTKCFIFLCSPLIPVTQTSTQMDSVQNLQKVTGKKNNFKITNFTITNFLGCSYLPLQNWPFDSILLTTNSLMVSHRNLSAAVYTECTSHSLVSSSSQIFFPPEAF